MPVSHNFFNLPSSSPHFPSHHFSSPSYSDSDSTKCKLVNPGFLYLQPICGAVIQNLLLVSSSTKENENRLDTTSLGDCEGFGQLRFFRVQKRIPLILLGKEGENQLTRASRRATQAHYFRFCSYKAKMKLRNE